MYILYVWTQFQLNKKVPLLPTPITAENLKITITQNEDDRTITNSTDSAGFLTESQKGDGITSDPRPSVSRDRETIPFRHLVNISLIDHENQLKEKVQDSPLKSTDHYVRESLA
jgi:hypothetical protein